MANTKTMQRSFGGGEVTPEFFGRIDDAKYQAGAALLRNFIVLPHGPAANRPGFAFVHEVKNTLVGTRLIPFSYSTTQTFVIELGAGYFRFHTNGATLESSPGVPYEIANPYGVSDIFDVHYVQSTDVMTLVHPGHPPKELRRLGALSWTLVDIPFAPPLLPPGAGAVTATLATSPANLVDYYYKISSIGPDGRDESLAGGPVVTNTPNNLTQTGAFNTITWALNGATRYNVYKQSNGLFGYIGQTDGASFVDENITADVSKTPPESYLPFAGAGNYPQAVSYFEQRRCFAGTFNSPQNLWMTRSGTESNLSFSLPTRDDDSINVRVAAREANTIRHIVPLSNLVLLTSAAEWRVTSEGGDALTPSTISVKPQSYIGANNAQPVIVNNNLIYAAARGGHVREMAYNFQASGYITGDLSLRAPHLFDGLRITDIAYAKSPQPMCWFISTSGKLLGLTYVPEQQIGAWHQHDTDGSFESIAVVAEGDDDVLYAIVRRTIGGGTKRYVERMAPRRFATQADAFFVDSGATYNGAPATTISGLPWLEGKTVNILADGAVHPQRVVTGGAITLDNPASKVHVGLPITADLQTLPLAMMVDNAYGQGRVKNINQAWLRVYRSSGIFVGPTEATLTPAKQRTNEPYGTPPALKSEEVQVVITPSWADSGQIFIRQVDPVPLTIAALTLEVALGG